MQKIDIRSEGSALLPCPAPGDTEASLRPEPQNSKRAARPCPARRTRRSRLPSCRIPPRAPGCTPSHARGQGSVGGSWGWAWPLSRGCSSPLAAQAPTRCHRGRPTFGCCQGLAPSSVPVGPFRSGSRLPGAQSPPWGPDRPVARGPAVGAAHTWAVNLVQPGAGAACRAQAFPLRAGPHPLGFSPGTAGGPLPPPRPHTGRPPGPGQAFALVLEPCVCMCVLPVCQCEPCVCTCVCPCRCVTTCMCVHVAG